MEDKSSMLRTSLLVPIFAAVSLAQAPVDTLQALLAEVHQLRMDLQATTVTAQRVQILLYRVQLQQAATLRAATHADEVRAKLGEAQRVRAGTAQNLQQSQDQANQLGADSPHAKALQAEVADLKHRVELLQADEQQWQSRDIDAQSQLRAEQSKLSGLQETLDKLDKLLETLANKQ